MLSIVQPYNVVDVRYLSQIKEKKKTQMILQQKNPPPSFSKKQIKLC